MTHKPHLPKLKKEGILGCLIALTSFYLLIELSCFIQFNHVYLTDFSYVSSKLSIPTAIWPTFLYFLSVQLFVHAIFCLLVWIVTRLIADEFDVQQRMKLAIGVWFLGMITVLVANRYFYPFSTFSYLLSTFLPTRFITHIVYSILISLCGVVLLLALYCLLKRLKRKIIIGICMLAASLIWLSNHVLQAALPHASNSQPNIIIIGIDAVRPDFLGYFGADTKTPFIDSFLNQATVFNESFTPIARTYSSWTSILTGEYPRVSGVRYDLQDQRDLQLPTSLGFILKQAGYHTVYASDETRFSNINNKFGFEQVITPPTGLNDFLLGTFNDFPLSNLLVNTTLGRFLFPYSYGNRPASVTYQPDSFLHLFAAKLQLPHNQPLFLAIHLCLTHTPYTWADAPPLNVGHIVPSYAASIERADQQVAGLFAILQKNHLLDHAIVVLLSDHGEGLELHGDRVTDPTLFVTDQHKSHVIPAFYPESLDHAGLDQAVGHGNDVLGVSQYRTLLAIKLYGMSQYQRAGLITGPVSLLDIKPTILALLQHQTLSLTGVSLIPQLAGQPLSTPSRDIFLESDFSPEAIRTAIPNIHQVVMQGADLFQINPKTLQLSVKDDMGKLIIKSKQHADVYGNWILALYPQTTGKDIPILVNMETGEWTDDLTTNFAQHSPAKRMEQALQAFYGSEARPVQNKASFRRCEEPIGRRSNLGSGDAICTQDN